jgi:hypothetical protein
MPEPPRRTRAFSLSEFCDHAEALHTTGDISGFVNFVLCGFVDDHQASVDINFNAVQDTDLDDLEISRDIDSMLGIDKDVRIRRRHLTIWPIPKYKETLKRNLHFKYSFENNEVRFSSTISSLQF